MFGRDVDRALNFVALGLGLAQKHDVEPIIAHDPEFVEAQTVMVTRALENATKLLTFEFIGIKPTYYRAGATSFVFGDQKYYLEEPFTPPAGVTKVIVGTDDCDVWFRYDAGGSQEVFVSAYTARV